MPKEVIFVLVCVALKPPAASRGLMTRFAQTPVENSISMGTRNAQSDWLLTVRHRSISTIKTVREIIDSNNGQSLASKRSRANFDSDNAQVPALIPADVSVKY